MTRFRRYAKYLAGGLLGAGLIAATHSANQARHALPQRLMYDLSNEQLLGVGKYKKRRNVRRRYTRRFDRRKSGSFVRSSRDVSKRVMYAAALGAAAAFGGYHGRRGAQMIDDGFPDLR